MNTLRVILLVVIFVALFESVEMKKTKKTKQSSSSESSSKSKSTKSVPCAGLFHCLDGTCLATDKVCNGNNDCDDGADETDCPPPSSTCRSCTYSDPECTNDRSKLLSAGYFGDFFKVEATISDCQNVCNQLLECKGFSYSRGNWLCEFYSKKLDVTLYSCNQNHQYFYYEQHNCE